MIVALLLAVAGSTMIASGDAEDAKEKVVYVEYGKTTEYTPTFNISVATVSDVTIGDNVNIKIAPAIVTDEKGNNTNTIKLTSSKEDKDYTYTVTIAGVAYNNNKTTTTITVETVGFNFGSSDKIETITAITGSQFSHYITKAVEINDKIDMGDVIYSAFGLPDGLYMEPNGLIYGNATKAVSEKEITITAVDAKYGTVKTCNMYVTVLDAKITINNVTTDGKIYNVDEDGKFNMEAIYAGVGTYTYSMGVPSGTDTKFEISSSVSSDIVKCDVEDNNIILTFSEKASGEFSFTIKETINSGDESISLYKNVTVYIMPALEFTNVPIADMVITF